MQMVFNKTGENRKALVTAIGEIAREKPKYMGAPGFAYSVGPYTITKNGTVEADVLAEPEAVVSLLAALSERGLIPDEVSGLDTAGSAEASDNVSEVSRDEMPDTLVIELPGEGFSDTAYANLQKLVAGKSALIREALGNDLTDSAKTLVVIRKDGKVCFPWFRFGMEPEKVSAWSCFAGALCAAAKKQKYVIQREKEYDGSLKYGMRCFLLKLGFIGDEYASARKLILAGMPGDGSRKYPQAV